ncbi:MAG TPA: ferrochelatase [Candidatus Binataceae bacterium]|nr:ferrochelatase [Candidatus Binataceae bacterium]
MSTGEKCDAILIIGFGAPSSADEIRPFLDRILRGRPIPHERYEEVIRHYEKIGGRSPYNELTMRQAAALGDLLANSGPAAPIEVGMRNTEPSIEAALRSLGERGARRVFGFIMAAHRCEASWERYQNAVFEVQKAIGRDAPVIEYPEPWHNHPLFIQAISARSREALEQIEADERLVAQLIFTAHSIPVSMDDLSGYSRQVIETSRLVAANLGIANWRVAFQSRSGDPREPWLEPDIGTAIRELGGGGVAVVVPVGFLVDHVEVLYDLDIEAAEVARAAGIKMVRAPTVGDHPLFIKMMAEIAQRHLGK